MKRLCKCIHECQNLLCYVHQISFPNSLVGSSLLRNVRLVLGACNLRTSMMQRATTQVSRTRILTFGQKHIRWWSCVVLLACSCSEQMSKHIRTTSTLGTSNFLAPAHFSTGLNQSAHTRIHKVFSNEHMPTTMKHNHGKHM